MYVCVCNAVTDSEIRDAVENGVRNLKQLRWSTGCGSSCGCCKEMATEVLQQALTERRVNESLIPVMQLA